MMNCQKFEIPKIDFIEKPSIKQLKEFGKKYQLQWKVLSDDREFLSVVLNDLKAADLLAQKILNVENPS